MTDANEHALLGAHLKTLRLPTFAHNHRPFAEDAARNNLGYGRYLLGLYFRCLDFPRLPRL